MKYLVLNNGIPVILDNDWYELLRGYSWTYQPCKHTNNVYAKRLVTTPNNGPGVYWMHHYISGYPINAGCGRKDFRVKFVDGDNKNMQRKNMVMVLPDGPPVEYPCYGGAGKTDFVGVRWSIEYGLWEAHVEGMVIGYASSVVGAAMIYNNKARTLFGTKAPLNKLEFIPMKYRESMPGRPGIPRKPIRE